MRQVLQEYNEISEDWKGKNFRHLSPHKHREIQYGAKVQVDPEEVDSPSIYAKGMTYVQAIVGERLFYGRAVYNKLLVALNNIETQQAAATESINEAINHLLGYFSTYPNNVIVYESIKMVLAVHSDDGFHNEPMGLSRAGARLFLV